MNFRGLISKIGLVKPAPALAVGGPALRGVNLGGWLVLEKWMTPELFNGLKATDEYGLCQILSGATRSMIRNHRDSFITQADFQWLAAHGVQAVRLPVGYWVFGDESPYFGAIEYVDKAFEWAQATGLKILLDLHGAPGSQNGWDHSGRAGECGWHRDEQNIIRTLDVVRRLAERYAERPELLGIELLNEPKHSVPKRELLRYYEAGYKLVRAKAGPDIWVVFHDAFRPRRWQRNLRAGEYKQMYIDTHQYQTFNKRDKRLDMAGHLHKTSVKIPRLLRKLSRRHPVIVGEWSLALDSLSLKGLDGNDLESAYRAYASAQLLAYDSTAAWFFWSYKTTSGGAWSFRDCIEKGWLPDFGNNEHTKNPGRSPEV